MQVGFEIRYPDLMDAPDFSTVDSSFGERFLEARRMKGLSQEAIATGLSARGINMHVTAIGKIERGERRVTIGEASALASTLGFTLDGLVGGGADLTTSYALSNRARDRFYDAWHEYLDSLIDVALAADSQSHPLRSRDREWLLYSMPQQTPARLLADVSLAFEARVEREGIEVGEHLQVLRAAIQQDDAAIQGLRTDG